MATLEKIRSKSVLLLVIIGVALLAFILGDFFSSGRTFFGTGTTVAKVGGQKIDIHQYQRKLEEASRQYQQSGQKIDNAVLQQQVLNSMLAEALYKQEIADLGLVVTDAELSEAMLGMGAAFTDRMVQQQVGVESAAQLHDMAYNPVKYGLEEAQAAQLREYWVNLENQIEEQLLQSKFQTLFSGAIVANQLDAKALYDENASTASFAYVKKDYASLPDDQFEVSDADLQAEWQKHKSAYAVPEETRNIRYIAVPIAPSQADRLEAQKKVENALVALRQSNGTEGLQDMPDFVVDRQKSNPLSLRDRRLRSFADTAKVGDAVMVSHMVDNYTLAKLINRSSEVDSVNVSVMAVAAPRNTIDSMINVLNNGGKFADMAQNEAVQQSNDSLWVSLLDPNMAEFKALLAEQASGVYFTPDTAAAAQGGRIFRINRRHSPAPVVDLAVVTFTAEPSVATINDLESSLLNYVNSHNTVASFADSAMTAGYQALPATVSFSTPQINRLEDSREAIVWAMNAKKGEVSPVFGDEQSGRFLALVVEDVYSDFVPATDTQVNAYLRSKVLNDKKAQAIISEYDGKAKDLIGYAGLFDVSVDTTTATFGQPMVPKFGMNRSEIQARIATAKKGELVGPVKGVNSVLFVEVVDVDDAGRPYNYEENAANYARTRGAYMLGNNLPSVLQGKEKVDNRLHKFFGQR
ncbi:MAG: SurA N-terminal domain-containing protein [Paramuribaculum sp.]|nr:SurA N-terminal domain-containing protein [Paramuribaculum sp.]